MLVMSHCSGDVIHVGEDVKIEIIKCEGARVTIGYVAPQQTKILRDKVKRRMDRKEKENDAPITAV